MAKQMVGQAKFQVPGGQATPAPPVGTSLGKYGINLGQFVSAFNERTREYNGTPIPVVVTVFSDRTFEFVTRARLRRRCSSRRPIASGSGEPNKKKVGKVTRAQIQDICHKKMADLNARDLAHAERMIEGTARSMGLEVEVRHGETIQSDEGHGGQKLLRKTPLELKEAIAILKSYPARKFDQSIEIHMNLGIDPAQADQIVRGSVVLPHGIGKTQRILVFAKGDLASAAEAAGADFRWPGGPGQEDQGRLDRFRRLHRHPRHDGRGWPLGKVLGPRGLMPAPRSGTVTTDVAKVIREYKAGKVEFRNDKGANIHALVGKLSFDADKLADNVQAFINYIHSIKPAAVKGTYIKSIALCATMSPSVRIAA